MSRSLTRLYKKQFGRGPESARASFVGPDALICLLSEEATGRKVRAFMSGVDVDQDISCEVFTLEPPSDPS